jgi:hypothetical protein
MSATLTEDQFFRDIENHEMIVVRDDGLNRHIRFKRPGTYNMHFDLVTWPGYLCYTGDMGTYVFQRLDDMFAFFRTDRKHQRPGGTRLAVNRSYWGEKLEAVGKHDGYREFSSEKFRANVMDWIAQAGLVGKLGHGLRDELESEVLEHADDGPNAAFRAARDFKWAGKSVFDDFYEVDCDEYTHRFRWCCYALAWGIEKYDATKQPAAEAVPA